MCLDSRARDHFGVWPKGYLSCQRTVGWHESVSADVILNQWIHSRVIFPEGLRLKGKYSLRSIRTDQAKVA